MFSLKVGSPIPQVQYWETGNETRQISHLSLPGDPLLPGRAKVTGLASNTNCTFQVAAVTENRLVGKFSSSVTATTLQYGMLCKILTFSDIITVLQYSYFSSCWFASACKFCG